jgi:hypothetical protein
VVRILYGVLAEVFWIFTGLVVGVAAVFAGANFRINSRGNSGLGFVWFFTSPACAVISGIAASACLANGTSFEDRVRICGGRRPFGMCRHAVMLTCAVSLVLSLSPGSNARLTACVSFALSGVNCAMFAVLYLFAATV